MTGRIARVIGSGIGLARESVAHHQQKEASEASLEDKTHSGSVAGDNDKGHIDNNDVEFSDKSANVNQSVPRESDSNDPDELIWQLDDIDQSSEHDTSNVFTSAKTERDLLNVFYELHPTPPHTKPINPLSAPIIIPQRRPHHRTRGFVRAYAPVLLDCGIDQKIFLDFLAGFEEAVKMHQAFNAVQPVIRGIDLGIQIASGGNLVAHAASWVIHASVEAGRRAYVQYKTNEYLDDMNLKFFQPHGLYALILCYKPSEAYLQPSDSVDTSVAKRIDGQGEKFSRKSGTTRSDLEMPDAAALLFPQLDAIPEDKKPNAVKRAGAFLGDYYDRRAQAVFEYNHPESKLGHMAPPRQEFASRYSDPNSAAVNSGLIGLVTGGTVVGPRSYFRQRRREEKLQNGESVAPRSRLLTEDVHYLMIVNLPSQQEIEKAKEQLLREQMV